MRSLFLILSTFATLLCHAQYGSFDAKTVQAAKANATLVVLDAGDSPYNRTIVNAMKANWKFSGSFDVITVNDLATQPIAADKNYLIKTLMSDPDNHTGTYLTLVSGWKQKKGEALEVKDNVVLNVPETQVLASLLIDPAAMAEQNTTAFLNIHVKCIQDFLKQVETGKITDKTSADRLYASRNRPMRDNMELWMGKENLDKSLPDAAATKEFYSHDLQVMDMGQLAAAASEGKSGVAVTEVILTGEHKTKWCFKRIFDANTGELMYLRDEAALYGKKEGFLDEDLKTLERAR